MLATFSQVLWRARATLSSFLFCEPALGWTISLPSVVGTSQGTRGQKRMVGLGPTCKKETREVQAILDCCLLNVLFINNSATAVTPWRSLYTMKCHSLPGTNGVKQIFLVPTGSARRTTRCRALRGTFRQETELPGWFVGSEQQSCHWATVNLSPSAPLLSWFIEGVNNRSGLGTGCKAQTLNFQCFCTPLCLQHFVSSSGELMFWLAVGGKGLLEGIPTASSAQGKSEHAHFHSPHS